MRILISNDDGMILPIRCSRKLNKEIGDVNFLHREPNKAVVMQLQWKYIADNGVL
jgi:broad specificity polyphosphatase/5'/3'-nucleotidase SurE